jgi:hypothetical protein
VRLSALLDRDLPVVKPGAQRNMPIPLIYLTQALYLPKKYLDITPSVIKKHAPCQSLQIKGKTSSSQGFQAIGDTATKGHVPHR